MSRPNAKSLIKGHKASLRHFESLPDGAQAWRRAPKQPRICRDVDGEAACGAEHTAISLDAGLVSCRACQRAVDAKQREAERWAAMSVDDVLHQSLQSGAGGK